MALFPGAIVDRYSLIAPVGEGGQGTVWRAQDRATGQPVALKLVRLALNEAQNERTRREARALARLDHPSLLKCRALFEDPERQLIGVELEWIEGGTLDDASEAQLASPTTQRRVVLHLASALAYLHARGVVHRDIKPANILCDARFWSASFDPSLIKVADLGISAPLGNPRPLTQTGLHVGTLMFMAPEVLDPKRWRAHTLGASSPAVDVFALGVLGWILTRRRHPTGLEEGSSTADLLEAYADFAERPAAWLPATTGDDLLTSCLRRCLCLRATERLTTAEIRDALA